MQLVKNYKDDKYQANKLLLSSLIVIKSRALLIVISLLATVTITISLSGANQLFIKQIIDQVSDTCKSIEFNVASLIGQSQLPCSLNSDWTRAEGRKSSDARLIELEEDLLEQDEQNFVWCDKISDWTILRRPARDSSEQLNSNSKLHNQLVIGSGEQIESSQQQQQQQQATRDCIWSQDLIENGHCAQVGPEDNRSRNDRIINQLKLDIRSDHDEDSGQQSFVRIAFANDHSHPLGGEIFLRDKCLVNKCLITNDFHEAQAIIFENSDLPVSGVGGGGDKWLALVNSELRWKQIWIAYLLESPPNTFDKRFVRRQRSGKHHQFNWTATYRSSSDIVTPYSKFVPYLDTIDQFIALKRHKSKQQSTWPNDADDDNDQDDTINNLIIKIKKQKQKKTKLSGAKVAWLVSNCNSHNNRLEFANELAKHIQVDIYGKCGNNMTTISCSKASHAECLQQLNANYKFYLSFENSNSREYITEKLYQNAYGYNDQNHYLLPIVMGASRRDYERLVPPNSFIHVDDFANSHELASYLKLLDSNDRLYAEYFRWKTLGRFIDTKFLCRVCALMHQTINSSRGCAKGAKTYKSIQDWWLNET